MYSCTSTCTDVLVHVLEVSYRVCILAVRLAPLANTAVRVPRTYLFPRGIPMGTPSWVLNLATAVQLYSSTTKLVHVVLILVIVGSYSCRILYSCRIQNLQLYLKVLNLVLVQLYY